jgi:hypothetical protein
MMYIIGRKIEFKDGSEIYQGIIEDKVSISTYNVPSDNYVVSLPDNSVHILNPINIVKIFPKPIPPIPIH